MPKITSPPTDPKDLLGFSQAQQKALGQEIGIFILYFATLENALNWCMCRLIQTDSHMAKIVLGAAIQNTNIRINILSSLINVRRMPTSIKKKLNKSVAQLSDLNDYRNWLVHDAFGPLMYRKSDDGTLSEVKWQKHRYRADRRLKRLYEEFSPEQVKQRATKCIRVSAEIMKHTKEYVIYRDRPHS